MSSITISTWMALEKPSFENFNEFIAGRLEDGIFRSIHLSLRNQLRDKKTASLTMPWGTYTAEVKTVGETTNITPSWKPSKNFLKLLNDDNASTADLRQESFDPEWVKLFKDYVAYGYFYPENTKNAPAREKGMRLNDDEVDYFLNNYMQVMVNIARDKQRDGKIYSLVIDEMVEHGSFDFEYNDDEIGVTFVPHKVFKQNLKDDSLTENMGTIVDMTVDAAAASVFGVKKHKKSPYKGFAHMPGAKRRFVEDDEGFLTIHDLAG